MAILSDVPGLRVEVHVAGSALKEYDDDETPPPKTVTKYIEAVSGAEFVIKYFFDRPFPTTYGVEAQIYVDGKRVGVDLNQAANLLVARAKVWEGGRVFVNGESFRSKFRFSDVKIDDDSADLEQLSEGHGVGAVGTIRVAFIHFVRQKESPLQDNHAGYKRPRERNTFSEKELKGQSVTHYSSMIPTKKTKERATRANYTVDYTEAGKAPFATIKFKYRSLQALKSMYIVPRTPSPVPLEERPAAELSPAELVELVNRMRKRDSEAAAAEKVKKEAQANVHVKRERDADDDDEVTFVSKHSKNERKVPQKDDFVIELD
ncbi:hypothetical protein K491DRAFT_719903 [Lophiostoma macrostomum CBS 122681]|uniref:DUF7918 domain-containing protein n=1 Tax=Lophiostoma macrostomum CBS 122681 TaxID=1314788 RepID=A0A6A6SXN0_9PLEO|nr:hypothetical protein K491DRAFT_719903 [Lophiostoma macrostomum CBS 122681]